MPDTDNCPRCGNHLTISEIIKLMNGSGYVRHVRVRGPDGKIVVVEANLVNPNTVEILPT